MVVEDPSSRSNVPSHRENNAIQSPRDIPPLPPNSFRDEKGESHRDVDVLIMVQEAQNTNLCNDNPSSSSIVSSQYPGNFDRKSLNKNYAMKPPVYNSFQVWRNNQESMNNNASQIQPSVTPDHQGKKQDVLISTFQDKSNNKESMNNNASQPSQQLPSLSPSSLTQPSVTPDHQGEKPDIISSSQTQPSKNNGTKTSTNISDPSASSSSTAGFLISSGTIPPLVETTKPSSLTRPLTAATAKTSSPATLSTTSTSRPSQLPGDTANGDHELKCRSCHNHVKDCCRQSVLAALGHKSSDAIQKGSQ